MELSVSEEKTLKRISSLLRTQGESLLNGTGCLVLSAKTLIILNVAFEWVTDADLESSFETTPAGAAQMPLLNDVQMLYDFIQKLVKLKVSHRNNSLQRPLALVSFRSVQHLELKGVPHHFVTGLAKIRPHLQSLTCMRCVLQMKDILEECGGDRVTVALTWKELTALHLRYNNIKQLDNSLRLVPNLTALDVSHNSITATLDKLQNLHELKALNLNFNKLSNIPQLSSVGRPHLRVLLLKYNHLTSIQGVQELCGLVELDLSGNLLASHDLLSPLLPLSYLRELRLEGNPIWYHKKHRKLTVPHLHTACIYVVKLDGKPLSKQEIKCHAKTASDVIGYPGPALTVNDSEMDQSVELYNEFFATTSPVTSQSEAEVRVSMATKKKKVPTATLR